MQKNSRAAVLVAAIVAFVMFSGPAAFAGGCKPLTLVSSIPILPASGDTSVLVPAKVQGTQVTMLLDTGGVFSELSEAVSDKLDLDTRQAHFQLINVLGKSQHRLAHAKSFTLGRLRASDVDFMLFKPGDPTLGSVEGVIAPNILVNYDVEFDFASRKLNLLSQDHCEGKVIYWPATAATVVPIRVKKSGHIFVPVTLDGVKVNALIDTGASNTTMTLITAESDFGLTPGSKDTPRIKSDDGTAYAHAYTHRFRQLAIGGIGVSNPLVAIIPDLADNKISDEPKTGSRLSKPDEPTHIADLIIGMDILHHLHLYIAYGEEKLYVTPAAVPAAAADTGQGHQAASGAH